MHKVRIVVRSILLLSLLAMLALPLQAKDEMDASPFVSVRVYDGVDLVDMDMDEAIRITVEGYLPIISASEGFIAYYWLPVDDELVTISVFASAEEASASNDAARDYIVENDLAAQLPNQPRIIEGPVDIGFVEMLDGMADGAASRLHASVRVYEGFEAEDLNEFVAIVEDGFLPIMRESDGFFGYYLMHGDAGALVAVSMFDSEASALASNEAARDFVAENLTQYLPNNPSITAGRVRVAVLAGVKDGANLIAPEVFASVRLYDGINPANQSEIARRTADGFLPIMRESEGFVGYYLMPADDKLAAISLFDSAEQAAASNQAARDFVVENLAPLLPNPPTLHEGTIELYARGDMMQRAPSSLYGSLRVYSDFDMAHFDEANVLAKSELVPALLAVDGFFAQYTVATTGSAVVAISIYDTPAAAAQANESAIAFSREHLSPWSPNDPTGFSGGLAVAALADTQDGANLIVPEVFVSVRLYDGVDPADQPEIQRIVAAGFLPIMRGSAGFVGYYLMPAGDKLAAISLFESAEQAVSATEAASGFVAENLAMLLPNPPTVVEGALDVFFLVDEMDMLTEDIHSLYASLRVYDNYDLSEREAEVDLVARIFVPQQQAAGGLFSYLTLDDGIDQLVAMTIYESEENALASNALAAAFVAEYSPATLPEDPVRINGQLGIAALADKADGANLIAREAFTSLRVYDGVDPADQAEIARRTAEGFLPIMRDSDGFIAYFLLPAGDTLASISAFDSAGQAAASNDAAREFVAENLLPLLPNPPTIVQGPMDTGYFALLDDTMTVEEVSSLYASLRVYVEVDISQRAESTALVQSIFLPILQEADGFWGYVRMHDGESHSVALSIYDSEANALAANEKAAAFVAEYISDRPDQVPLRVNGQLAVAALADINMGANLVGMMEE